MAILLQELWCTESQIKEIKMALTKVTHPMIVPPPFDVTAYGAVGDGTTDDTNAIKAAIAAAEGGLVYFPPGQYRITSALNVGTTYAFRVSAIYATLTGTASSAFSDTVTATLQSIPGSPQNLVLTPSDAQIVITWDPPQTSNNDAPVTGYTVEKGTDGINWITLQNGIGAADTRSVTAAQLTNGTTYFFRVTTLSAIGAVGNVIRSASPARLPSAPLNLIATPFSATRIDLTWDIPTDNGGSPILGYTLEINSGSGWAPAFNGARIPIASGATNGSASVPGLNSATPYTFRLTAVNGIGSGPVSNEARAISASLAGTAQNVKATGAGSGMVLLTWDAPTTTGGLPVTSYEVQVSPDGSTWTPSTVSSSTFSKMFTNLVDGRTYFFRGNQL